MITANASSNKTTADNRSTARQRQSKQDTIRLAAKSLGALPKNLVNGRRKKKRTWTGFIGTTRMYVEQPVVLPDGSPGWVKCVQGGIAVVRTAVWDPKDSWVHQYVPVSHLRIAKDPNAVLLGAQKRGKIERKSERKAAAARLNGAKSSGPMKKLHGPQLAIGSIELLLRACT